MKPELRIFDEDGIELNLDEVAGLNVNCFRCWKKLKEKGAILFSPPERTSSDNVDTVKKFHICKPCYTETLEFLMGDESPNKKRQVVS